MLVAGVFFHTFATLPDAAVAVMLIMRTYALYERNKFVLAFMIFITLTASSFAVVRCGIAAGKHRT
jgi:hypothetical protein